MVCGWFACLDLIVYVLLFSLFVLLWFCLLLWLLFCCLDWLLVLGVADFDGLLWFGFKWCLGWF